MTVWLKTNQSGPQSTSSTESESIEWGRAAKAMLRFKGALDACRLKPVPCDGYVDNDALRLAVHRGSPAKLGHLRVHAETCFRLLAQPPISLHRVGTAENEADIMTKVLSAVRHRQLCKTDFDLDAVLEASVMLHAAMCRHAGWRSLGSPEDVFSCPCTTARSRRVQKMFFVVFHQSFAKAALVRQDISCRCALNRIS